MVNEKALKQATIKPIETDEQLRKLAQDLLQHAIRRQCWLMFFTAERTPIELLIPIDELPYEPDQDVDNFAGVVGDIVRRCDAAAIAVVWERVGGAESMPAELLWISAVDHAFRQAGLEVRAQLVVHDDGVRLVDVDEAREAAARLQADARAGSERGAGSELGAEPKRGAGSELVAESKRGAEPELAAEPDVDGPAAAMALAS